MRLAASLLCAFTALLALVLTRVTIALARRFRVIDTPNQRSSHTAPTPRAGGVAIVLAIAAANAWLLTDGGASELEVWLWIWAGAIIVAMTGLIDDARGLPALVRLVCHIIAAGLCVYGSLGFDPHGLVEHARLSSWSIIFPAALALLGAWYINLYNFMDGIDGIAACQAIFVGICGAVLIDLCGGPHFLALQWVLLACASAGFLWFNWAPARIFLGDSGSGFLGFWCFALTLVSGLAVEASLWPWLILMTTFIADATTVLGVRIALGQMPHTAHRSHLYQILSRRFRSHSITTRMIVVVNVLWVLPLALLAARYPTQGPLLFLAAVLPMVAIVVALGGGRAK